MRARELGFAQISAVALFKRLRRAEPWLRDLCQYLLAEQQRRLGRCAWPSEYRVRAVDATDIKAPGSTGTDRRIHYSICLPELSCDHYELTDYKGGEKLGRFGFQKNELILANRGYRHRAGAAQVLESGAALLMRWHPGVFPVQAAGGGDFNLFAHLRRLPQRAARVCLAVIAPALPLGQFLRRGRAIARALRVVRPDRSLPLVKARKILLKD